MTHSSEVLERQADVSTRTTRAERELARVPAIIPVPEGYALEEWRRLVAAVACLEDEFPEAPPPDPWPADGTPCVYFIECAGTGAVKIGITTRLVLRVQQLWTLLPYGIEAVWHCPGGRELEKSLHRELADHRLCGEWFLPSPAVIERRAGLGCVSVASEAVDPFRHARKHLPAQAMTPTPTGHKAGYPILSQPDARGEV